MSDATLTDVLSVNMVLVGPRLLQTPDARHRFDRAVVAEVVQAPGLQLGIGGPAIEIGVGSGPTLSLDQVVLNIEKDRVSLNIAAGRATIQMGYPDEKGLKRLAEICDHAIIHSRISDQMVKAYGFNLEAVYDLTTSARDFMAAHLLRNPFKGHRFTGGSVRFMFDESGNQLTLVAEPRFGKHDANKMFMSLNLNVSLSSAPKRSRIEAHLWDVWEKRNLLTDKL